MVLSEGCPDNSFSGCDKHCLDMAMNECARNLSFLTWEAYHIGKEEMTLIFPGCGFQVKMLPLSDCLTHSIISKIAFFSLGLIFELLAKKFIAIVFQFHCHSFTPGSNLDVLSLVQQICETIVPFVIEA